MSMRRNPWRTRPGRLALVVALAAVSSVFALSGSSSADVTGVTGNAYGYFLSVSLFGGPPILRGPAPQVTLASDGSNSPQTATQPSASAVVGPANFFSSGQIDVGTAGTIGPTGSVTTTASIDNITTASGGVLAATNVDSSCTSSATTGALSGTTTIIGGVLETDSGDDVNGDGDFIDPGEHAPVTQPVPTSPVANSPAIPGHIHVNGAQDNFSYQFNEQITNPDGSLTVFAAHQRLFGPTAVGDLFLGKSQCGITGTIATTTVTPTTTTTVTPTTTTTVTPTTTTTVTPTTTTTVTPTTTTTVTPTTTTTTTVTPTTTTTVTPTTTTTVTPTTVPPIAATTASPAQVPPAPPTPPGGLPQTGSSNSLMLLLGFGFVAVGLCVTAAVRRRPHA